jgi:NitT/TauT family transport system ATP-binding protein
VRTLVSHKPALDPAVPASQSPAADEPAVRLRGIGKVFGTDRGRRVRALESVDLDIHRGEFLSVVGPSGCGKSTLLTLMAGLDRPSSGELRVLGEPVDGLVSDIGFAFQRDALLPWRTAAQNVALPLRFRGRKRGEALEEARYWLDRVGLTRHHDRYPHQLSGGMRKRVAVAAALSYKPSVLLMDEPFSALDVQTRNLMENDLLALCAELGQTVVLITHDLEEAIGMSDRVVVLSAGPGRIISDYAIPLPRPRDLLEIRADPRFGALYGELWSHLRDEVLRARDERED